MATNATVTILDSWDVGTKSDKLKRKAYLLSYVATGNPTIVLADLATPAPARFYELHGSYRTDATPTTQAWVRANDSTSITNASITTGTWETLVYAL